MMQEQPTQFRIPTPNNNDPIGYSIGTFSPSDLTVFIDGEPSSLFGDYYYMYDATKNAYVLVLSTTFIGQAKYIATLFREPKTISLHFGSGYMHEMRIDFPEAMYVMAAGSGKDGNLTLEETYSFVSEDMETHIIRDEGEPLPSLDDIPREDLLD